MKGERKRQLERFVLTLGLPRFHDLNLLDRALTHSSYANENKFHHIFHNERLEFLGDAILDLVVGEYVYRHYPNMPEGELSKARASVVSETPLASVGCDFQMGDYLLLGKGEAATGGKTRPSILADAFEAVVGAIYLDSSYQAAQTFILCRLRPYLQLVDSGNYGKDYKTLFQEFVQRKGEQSIAYFLDHEEGPDHNKTFYMAVAVNGRVLGKGAGKTKKDAEQHAAHEALKTLNALV